MEVGLGDIIAIVLALIGCAAALFVGMVLVASWPRPWSDLLLLSRALWRRYIGDLPSLAERIADLGVNDFDVPPSQAVQHYFRNRPQTMSSSGDAEPPAEPVRPDRTLPDTY